MKDFQSQYEKYNFTAVFEEDHGGNIRYFVATYQGYELTEEHYTYVLLLSLRGDLGSFTTSSVIRENAGARYCRR